MTLRKKLILAFLLLGLAPTALLGGLFALASVSLAMRNARADLDRTLDAFSGALRADVDSAAVLLRRQAAELAGSPQRMSRERLEQLAASNIHTFRMFNRPPHAALRVTLLHPQLDAAMTLEGTYRNVPSEIVLGWTWRPIQAGWPAGIRDAVDAACGSAAGPELRTFVEPRGPALALAVPWRTSADGRAGALVEEIDIPTLLEHATGETAGCRVGDCFAAARAAKGDAWRFLYHTDPTLIGLEVGGGGPLSSPEGPGLEAPEHRVFVQRGDTLTAFGVERTTHWLVGGSMSLAPRLGPVRTGARIGLLLFLVTTGLVIGGIALVTRGIGGAVEEIAASAGAVARGDFRQTIRTRRSDEFGAIAEHINEMARDLALTAESRSIARLSSRLVHDLKGVASQMGLLLYNLKENYDDPEFRAEFPGLMEQLVGQVESLALQLKHGRADDPAPPGRVDLDALVRRVVDGRTRSLPPGVRVVVDLCAGSAVTANEGLLVGVLDNLLSNAVEAMERGGILTVRTGPADAAPRGRTDRPPAAFVEIEDTGRGMSREFVETQLFEPFVTTKEKGLGLGMYQVRRDVARLGGRIAVRSRPGHGTCVRVEVGLYEDHSDR